MTKIDDIMDYFDFHKVHSVMEFLEWEWMSCDGVPSEAEIRRQARELLTDVENDGILATGGLRAEKTGNGSLELSFVLERWGND